MQSTTSNTIERQDQIVPAIMGGAVKLGVVARLTVIRTDGMRTIVEVHSDARFHSFYHFYRQCGKKRSTKELIRTASRNEGLNQIGYWQPGLETIACRLEKYACQSNPVVKKTIRIIQRRAYRKLISARPDQLGLTKTTSLPITRTFYTARHG